LIAQHVKIDWIPSAASLSDKQSSGTTLEYNQAGIDMIGGFAPVESGACSPPCRYLNPPRI